MGNNISINKINYEDLQYAINNNYIIISTLHKNMQDCLIKNTLSIDNEVVFFNNNQKKDIFIIIYGINNTDESIIKKYNQIINLGYKNVYIYLGGIFEWLLLQEIYGFDLFPTTIEEIDILKYKGINKFNKLMLK